MADKPKFTYEVIHRHNIIGQMIAPSGRSRVILVDRGDHKVIGRWVVASHYAGDNEWDNGDYYDDLNKAIDVMVERAKRVANAS